MHTVPGFLMVIRQLVKVIMNLVIILQEICVIITLNFEGIQFKISCQNSCALKDGFRKSGHIIKDCSIPVSHK